MVRASVRHCAWRWSLGVFDALMSREQLWTPAFARVTATGADLSPGGCAVPNDHHAPPSKCLIASSISECAKS